MYLRESSSLRSLASLISLHRSQWLSHCYRRPLAFHAPAFAPAFSQPTVNMKFKEGDVGVTPPLALWDPLGLIEKRDMRRYEIMEIKHGPQQPCSASSTSSSSTPAFAFRAIFTIRGPQVRRHADRMLCITLEAVPIAGWLAIMLTTCMTETGASASTACDTHA